MMIKNLLAWIKNNKVLFFALLGLLFLLASIFAPAPFRFRQSSFMSSDKYMAYDMAPTAPAVEMQMGYGMADTSRGMPSPVYSGSTNLYAQDRKVITTSDLSLLISDVRASLTAISQYVDSNGGFVVNSSVNRPEEGGTGYISIRVPNEQREATLVFLRQHSVRVISENIQGNDVTDQYSDAEARLATLEKTKATFEAMLDQANTVEEILKVQQSILNVQDQIDAIKGQLQYLENTSSSSLISIYLATDELALPYSPAEPWRPQVIFKTAVRSLVTNLRGIAALAIWGVVYLPLILVVIATLWIVRKLLIKK